MSNLPTWSADARAWIDASGILQSTAPSISEIFAKLARRSLNSALQLQLSHKISRGSGATWTVRVYHNMELITLVKNKIEIRKKDVS